MGAGGKHPNTVHRRRLLPDGRRQVSRCTGLFRCGGGLVCLSNALPEFVPPDGLPPFVPDVRRPPDFAPGLLLYLKGPVPKTDGPSGPDHERHQKRRPRCKDGDQLPCNGIPADERYLQRDDGGNQIAENLRL